MRIKKENREMKVKVVVEYEVEVEAEGSFLNVGPSKAVRLVEVKPMEKPDVLPAYEDSDNEWVFGCDSCGMQDYDMLDHECDLTESMKEFYDVEEETTNV